jgi:hypothetical protein
MLSTRKRLGRRRRGTPIPRSSDSAVRYAPFRLAKLADAAGAILQLISSAHGGLIGPDREVEGSRRG